MTPTAYIKAFAHGRRMAERKRLALAAGITPAAIRAYTSEVTRKDGTTGSKRRCADAAVAIRLEKATNGLVTVAEWNPQFAPLVK